MEAKEVSQLDTVTLDNNSLIPVYTEENGLGKVTLQSAKNAIGVEISSVTAQTSQGAVGSSASVAVTKGGTSQQTSFDFAFSIPAPNEIDSITTVQDNTDSGTSVVTIETADGNTESFNVKNGKGISSITEDSNTANGATRAITVTYSDGTTSALSVKNGEGIDSVTVNQSSSAGATSTMTLTMSNGTTQTLSVKNGKDFHIEKSYASIAAMEADFANMEAYDFVMIDTGSVEDVDTGKLYYKDSSAWQYVGDLSGKQGIKGDTGVGIASLSFSESQVSSGVNVLTVTLTDGTSQTFNIRNGSKGDTGERGTGVFAGTDSYTEVGHTKTIGPSTSVCDEGLIIEVSLYTRSYTVPYKEGDIYINTQTNDVYKIHEGTIIFSSSVYAYYLYVEKIGNIQGKSVGSITAPSTVDTSSGAGNTYTVKDTDGNSIGTFTVYNANNTNADTLTTARTFTIADADDTNSGVPVSFDGSGNVTLHLPSTAKINITGNAATADNADMVDGYHASESAQGHTVGARDANGYFNARIFHDDWGEENINSFSSPKIMFKGNNDGYIRNTDPSNVKVGAATNADTLDGIDSICFMHERTGDTGTTTQFQAEIENNTLAGPCCGSYQITDGPVGDAWYNYIFIPHRTGVGNDSWMYGILIIFTMTANSNRMWINHYIGRVWYGWEEIRAGIATSADKIRTSAPSSPSAGDIWIS